MKKSLIKGLYKIIDRRAHPRFRVNYIAEVYSNEKITTATAIDISVGGIGLLLNEEFKIGELLDIRMESDLYDAIHSEIRNLILNIKTEFVWIKKIGNSYRAGLRIVDVDTIDIERLKRNIEIIKERIKK